MGLKLSNFWIAISSSGDAFSHSVWDVDVCVFAKLLPPIQYFRYIIISQSLPISLHTSCVCVISEHISEGLQLVLVSRNKSHIREQEAMSQFSWSAQTCWAHRFPDSLVVFKVPLGLFDTRTSESLISGISTNNTFLWGETMEWI